MTLIKPCTVNISNYPGTIFPGLPRDGDRCCAKLVTGVQRRSMQYSDGNILSRPDRQIAFPRVIELSTPPCLSRRKQLLRYQMKMFASLAERLPKQDCGGLWKPSAGARCPPRSAHARVHSVNRSARRHAIPAMINDDCVQYPIYSEK